MEIERDIFWVWVHRPNHLIMVLYTLFQWLSLLHYLSGASALALSTSLGPSIPLHDCTASSRASASAIIGPLLHDKEQYINKVAYY